MKRALTIEQHQDAMLAVFMWAVRYATGTFKDDAKALAWLEPQFGSRAMRVAIYAAIQRLPSRPS